MARLADANAVVLAESVQKLNALLQHAIPGVALQVVQALVLTSAPFVKQSSCSIFAQEISSECAFKCAPKEHGGACIFFLPGIEVTVAITPRAGQVLADLRVAVGHQATCEPSRFEGESSSQPPAGAKPSSRSREAPLMMMWLIFTTPVRPINCDSSTSSRPSSSTS